MTRTYVVSGAASGIGAATVTHLRDGGHRVLTVDRTSTGLDGGSIDVVADLATPVGRAEAVAGVDEIAATPGVDMIFVGPFDLALSLGTDVTLLLGDSSPENPLDRIVAACRAHGVAAGAFAGSNELAAQLAARGFDTLAVAVDTMLLHDAVAQQLESAPR